jgi:hypothetical protein
LFLHSLFLKMVMNGTVGLPNNFGGSVYQFFQEEKIKNTFFLFS